VARKSIFIILFIILAKTILSQGWQWQNPKPLGDPIHQVLFIDNQVGWMAPENSTLLKTTNGGISWSTIYTNVYFDKLFFLNRNEGWAVGRKHYVPEYTNSVYHTTNGGLSWEEQLADTLNNNYPNIFFLDKNHGWTGDFLNLYSTKDGGKNWQIEALNDFPIAREIFGVLFLDTLKGWVFGDSYYGLKTTDGGKSWVRDSSLSHTLRLITIDTLNIWAVFATKVKKTTDGGITWKVMKEDSTYEINTDFFVQDTSSVYLSTNRGFYESTNGGQTWKKNSYEVLNGFSVINNDEIWGGGAMNALSSKIVHSTDNGETWTNLLTVNNPFGYSTYGDVDFVDKNTGWIIKELDSKILKTTDGGNSWQEQSIFTDEWLRRIFMIDSEIGYVIGRNGIIFKTTNGGNDWLSQNSGTNYDLTSIDFLTERNGWVVGTTLDNYTGILLKTTNGGETWGKVDVNGAAGPTDVCFIDSLHGWVAAGYNSINDLGRIFKTIDAGETWTELTGGSSINFRHILFVDSTKGFSFGYKSPYAEIYSTTDGGKSWGTKKFEYTTFSRVKFIDKKNGWLIGPFGIIYGTTDGGSSWERQHTYTSRNLNGIDFIDANNGWAVGWYGAILHTTDGGITFVDNKEKTNGVPANFSLYQNYPNPFNPSTTFKYEIPEESFVKIIIYDILGREIVTLVNEFKAAGKYSVTFNAGNLASGVYIYQLGARGFVINKKLVLMK